MTHDSATEGCTEAAAVDQAIADVRRRADLWVQHDEIQTMVSREFAESLRVLADAVEELRADNQRKNDLNIQCLETIRTGGLLREQIEAEKEAAEAERDEWERVAGESQNRMSEHAFRAERLARQVADLSAENESLRRERSSLEAALREIAGLDDGDSWLFTSREIARAALALFDRKEQT